MSTPGDDAPPDGTGTTLARREGALEPGAPDALVRPEDAVPDGIRTALPALLEGSVAAFGDVVSALLTDLSETDASMRRLSWLASTPTLLEDEGRYHAALDQLQWWDAFLARLPYPQLLSDQTARAREQHARARRRALLTARDEALQDHQRLVALEAQDLADEGASQGELRALARVHAEPREGEWRVDPDDYVQAALAALPPAPDPVPISRGDLDPQVHFSGFTAAQRMRADPELGPRAAHLDAVAAEVLVTHLGLDRETAAVEGRLLTDMFWLALRRALQAGSHQLATSIRFVSGAAEDPVQAQFTRELLRSWLHALETLPEPRRSAVQRLLGLGKAKKAPEITASSPRQLTDGGVPRAGKPSLWERIRGKDSE